MKIESIGNKIASSNAYKVAGKQLNKFCDKIGPMLSNVLDRHPKADKFLKMVEPTGANNAFLGMSSLMVGTVIVPRVLTAKKRNPDNKEATKDEIKEILFRDVQTVLIILFSLKAMNSLVAAAATKMKGLPLTNKPYQKLFNSETKSFKGIKDKAGEFAAHPIQKLKTIGKNLIDTLHPTKGVITLTNEECREKYSKFNSLEDINKLFDEIDNNGGKSDKVFVSIMNSIIKKQKECIQMLEKEQASIVGMKDIDTSKLKQAQTNLKKLEALKEGGIEKFREFSNQGPINNNDIRFTELLNFFQDKNNSLVEEALGLNAILRTIALGIEMTYLGFGLPALNQRRLEKKYLKDGAAQDNQKTDNCNHLINNNIKAQEIKLFHNFIK